MATIIDGKAIAQTIRNEIAQEVRSLSDTHHKVPGLAVVIVGTRKDSQSYVNMKRKACAEVGIRSFDLDLPEQISESELIAKVHELNANSDVHDIDRMEIVGENNKFAEQKSHHRCRRRKHDWRMTAPLR